MKTKLTLSIEETVINKVKTLSQKQSQSISSIVENYLKSLIASQNKQSKSFKKEPSFTEQFRKKFPVTKAVSSYENDKKEWHKHLEEKYGN